jgi:1-aminocyclopropane-1-carboxylate deaminase/D-cysteine desulfhydrase-like pyridoxal-dependent ACC family enzyme
VYGVCMRALQIFLQLKPSNDFDYVVCIVGAVGTFAI